MKRKLLFTIVALLCSVSTWADVTIDITSPRVKNADLSSLTGWTFDDSYSATGNDYENWKTDGDANVIEFYSEWSASPGAMASSKNFKIVQTISLTAGTYRLKANGFYREKGGDGTNTKAYLKAGTNQQYLAGLSANGLDSYSYGSHNSDKDLYKAANAFSLGDFSNTLEFTLASSQSIEIGVVGTFNTQTSWCIIGPMSLVKVLEDGTEVTDIIVNAEVASTDDWEGAVTNSGQKYTGAPDDYYFDACYWWEDHTYDMNQTISSLPQGCYSLKVATRAREDFPVSYIYVAQNGSHIKEVSVNKDNDEGGTLGNGWSWTDFRFIKPNNNDLTIGFYAECGGNGRWAGADDFHLYYLGEVPTDDDKSTFNTTLSTANGYILGFESGEYAPYTNVTAITALIAANDIDPDLATKAELTSASSAIGADKWTVNTELMNAIYNPTFALSENNMTALGWGSDDGAVIGNESGEYHSRALVGNNNLSAFNETKSALYLRYDGSGTSNVSTIYNYGTVAGYTMPLKAGTIYRVKADAAVWATDNTQWYKDLRVAVLNSSSVEIGGQTLRTPYSTMGNGSSTDKISYDFLFCPSADGNYTLTVDNMAETSTGIVISNFELKKATFDIDEDSNCAPEVSGNTKVTITRTFNDGAWNTLVLPFDMSLSEAKEVFGNDIVLADYLGTEGGLLRFSTVDAEIKANEPLLIWGANNLDKEDIGNWDLEVSTPTLTPDGASYSFVGSYDASTTLLDGDYFIGSNNNLYYIDGTSLTMKGTRGIFRPVGGGSIKALSFSVDGEATGIMVVDGKEMLGLDSVYNLAGQRVSKPTKGLYIKNGKKVIIK